MDWKEFFKKQAQKLISAIVDIAISLLNVKANNLINQWQNYYSWSIQATCIFLPNGLDQVR